MRNRFRAGLRFVCALLFAATGLLTQAATAADTSRFTQQYSEARKLYDSSRWDDAIKVYSDIIRADPLQDGAYNMRSLAYSNKGMRSQSLEDLRRAVELAPTNAVYRFNLGLEYYSSGQMDRTIAELDQAQKLGYNKNPLLFRYRGAARLSKGLNEAAIEDATEAIRFNTADGFARGVRARALLRMEKYKEAIDDSVFYLRTAPDDNLALAEQGYAYYKLGMLEEARRNAARLMEMEPRLRINFDGDKALGIYDRDMRRARVKEQLDAAQAAEAAGDWPVAFAAYSAARAWSMGYSASDRADGERATEGVVGAYLKLSQKPALPEEARRYVVQARTYITDKRFEDARKALDLALSLAPWYPNFHYDKALVSAELKNYPMAIASMKYYLKISPDGPDARQVQDKIYEWEARMK